MSYIRKRVYLSDAQKSKLKTALLNQQNVTLRINRYATPNYEMFLTPTQIVRIGNDKQISVSKNQLIKNGGFLPFLLPLLAALGTGVASGAAGWGTKKILDKVAGSGCPACRKKKKKRGKGVLQNWELPITQ